MLSLEAQDNDATLFVFVFVFAFAFAKVSVEDVNTAAGAAARWIPCFINASVLDSVSTKIDKVMMQVFIMGCINVVLADYGDYFLFCGLWWWVVKIFFFF
jgi:hypothetical protein